MNISFSHKFLAFSLYVMAVFPLLPKKILGLPVILLIISSFINFILTKKSSFNYKELFRLFYF
jgi:hypothetical protein